MALLWICLLGRAVAQEAPTLTVTGNEVTIAADIAWHNPDLNGVEIVQGTPLQHPSVIASSDGASPIILRMPAGTHEITALGYPADRMKPIREQATLAADIAAATRQQQISELYATYLSTRDQIIAMSPTTAEAINAILAYARGTE
jgi:hypothetical protein